MESEKVKEIKEALENCTNNYGTDCYHCPYLEKGCNIKLMEDSLTLINELESENETLKDEITELENEKRQLCKAINSIQKGFENGEFVSKDCQTKILKQFAERLKEKIVSMKWAREDTNEKLIKQGTTIKAIDETLKEFIK